MPSRPFDYRPGFLDEEEAGSLFEQLRDELPWSQFRIRVYGREHLQPRLTAWCCDPGLSYAYSGKRLQAAAWHPALHALREQLEQATAGRFNSVLANAYRDGADAMGWHADDEPELGQRPVIASVSLGAKRRMLLRRKSGGPSRRLELEHGSLLLMRGDSQANWLHSIPRTRKRVGLRINLTYRRIRGAGSLR